MNDVEYFPTKLGADLQKWASVKSPLAFSTGNTESDFAYSEK